MLLRLISCSVALLCAAATSALAQGTGFTYQGLLQQSGTPYTGLAEFQPSLWDAASGGATVAVNSPATLIAGVTNGLFVLPLNFGANFPGAGRWLQLDVRTNLGAFTPLLPRQAITATPYALTASNLSGTLPAAQISGVLASGQLGGSYGSAVTFNNVANSFSGSGANLTDLNASQLSTGTVPDARLAANVARTNQVWLLGGNAGANPTNGNFIGTTDNLPLEFRVNGARALRIEPNASGSPNVIAGSPGNFVAAGVVGATIAGGGSVNYLGNPYTNKVTANFGTVVGGRDNTASGNSSTAMGNQTTASGDASTAMGVITTASGTYSTAMGYRAKANHSGSFVWADYQELDIASTAFNQFTIRAQNGLRLSDGTSLFMGGNLGQKINLYNATYGIGIQSGIQYCRVGTGGGFGWYAGGVHNDNTYNAGGGLTLMKLDTSGLTVNGTLVNGSDRNTKENFAPVDSRAVLEKVAALPLSQWNYKADTGTRHLGPMAQDFYAAFNIGPDDKHIATVDADGVALAAIQGLNQKFEAEAKSKDARIRELEARLEKLERLMEAKGTSR